MDSLLDINNLSLNKDKDLDNILEVEKRKKDVYEEDKKNLKDLEDSVTTDDEYEDRIIKDLLKVKNEDDFTIFKNTFNKRFITQKKTYKGKDYYINTCFYQRGKFNLKYVIKSKKYQASFSMTELRMHKNGIRFFKKIFIEDKKQKVRDQILNDVKGDIYYFKFDFSIFKAILCRYLFEFKHKKKLNIWDTDFYIFSLIHNNDFISVLEQFDEDENL